MLVWMLLLRWMRREMQSPMSFCSLSSTSQLSKLQKKITLVFIVKKSLRILMITQNNTKFGYLAAKSAHRAPPDFIAKELFALRVLFRRSKYPFYTFLAKTWLAIEIIYWIFLGCIIFYISLLTRIQIILKQFANTPASGCLEKHFCSITSLSYCKQ